MTSARQNQISLEETPYYHCYVRCVRRAFLFGHDLETGTNYNHRKQWIVSRIRFLSTAFSINVCAYAVMSNHYHVVLHVDKDRALAWSQQEVANRWCELFKPTLLVERWLSAPKSLSKTEIKTVFETLEVWRERLYNIGWFMRCINEPIARMANKEDNCKGRFWEGRYKSQALLDEGALLTCMTYVDLNPVRAGLAESLQNNDFTAIQQRLVAYGQSQKTDEKTQSQLHKRIKSQQQLAQELDVAQWPQAPLMPFEGFAGSTDSALLTDAMPIADEDKATGGSCIPFTLNSYIQLVQETGQLLCRSNKKGCLSKASEAVLAGLGLNANYWLEHVLGFEHFYGRSVGSANRLFGQARSRDRAWVKGVGSVGRLYQVC